MLEVRVDDEKAVVTDRSNDHRREFELDEDLDRSLELLRKVYATKTETGQPIYETRKVAGKSIWSTRQHILFLEHLRPYVMFEDLIEYLVDEGIERVKLYDRTDDKAATPTRYLRSVGIDVVQPNEDRPLDAIRELLDTLGTAKYFARVILLFVLGVVTTVIASLWLIFLRHDILVFTPDKLSDDEHRCDFRFRQVYEFLEDRDMPFVEVFHTLWLLQRFLLNLLRRRRVAIYLEALDPPSNLMLYSHDLGYDLSHFEEYHRGYFRNLITTCDETCQDIRIQAKILSIILKYSAVNTLLAMDDMRYAPTLLLACQKHDIETYGVQHGQLNRYQVGWMNYGIPREASVAFDTLYVWSEYWRDVLVTNSTVYHEDNVGISGSTAEFVDYVPDDASSVERIRDLTLLVPYEAYANKDEVREYLDQFRAQGLDIYFKTRPDIPVNDQIDAYGLERESVELIQELDGDVLSEIDCVAGTYSTLLYEMIYYGKPVLWLDTSSNYGRQLVEDGLSLHVSELDPERILTYVNDYDWQSMRERVWSHHDADFTVTLDSVLDFEKSTNDRVEDHSEYRSA